MTKPTAIIIGGELAEQHANTLQGLYDFNKQGFPVKGLFLEQVQDVIRSLRGQTTAQAAFAKAWEGYEKLEGVYFERYMAGLLPSGEPIKL